MDADSSFVPPEQTCQHFTFAEIQSATHNFDERLVIGRGGFGKVYRCPYLGSIGKVAVKRMDSISDQGAVQFEAEVKVLSKLRHGNVVPLVGYCKEGKEMVLAYEFIPNGTLKDHLHKHDSALSWLQRLKICVDAARGLDYLHTGTSTQHGIIHRDVKTSNILLDTNFAAKIGDFGLAKVARTDQTLSCVSTRVKGTFGYMDPCYFKTGKVTRKSDVYAFGVVLFEVLSGKQAVDITLDEEQCSLVAWAQDQIKEGKLNQMIDSRLMGQISRKCLREFASIANQCVCIQPKQRPTMAQLVVKLGSILSHERERATSVVVDEGRLISKVKTFFTGKVDDKVGSKPDDKVGSKPDDKVGESKPDFSIQKSKDSGLRSFTYAELVRATHNFKPVVLSPYKTIYQGWVDEETYAPTKWGVGLAIGVRKEWIKTSKLDQKLIRFSHPNIMKLVGYCLSDQDMFWVYEFIPGIHLDDYLSGELGTPPLSWADRLEIAVGAAQGLSVFHKKGNPAYRQFRSCHVLVDKERNARLLNYEMENLLAKPGWSTYEKDKLDGIFVSGPRYDSGVQSEIYAFGIVLLEILTGMKVCDENRSLEKQDLVKWTTPWLADEVNLGMIVDIQLQQNDYPPKGALKLAQLVSNCIQPEIDKQPSITEVLQVLHQL